MVVAWEGVVGVKGALAVGAWAVGAQEEVVQVEEVMAAVVMAMAEMAVEVEGMVEVPVVWEAMEGVEAVAHTEQSRLRRADCDLCSLKVLS